MTKPLTSKAIETRKADPTKRLEFPDAGSGLYFIVQPSGVRSWAYRYRYRDKPRKLTLGRYPTLSLADARERMRKALEALEAGRDPAAEKSKAEPDDGERDLVPVVADQFIERWAMPNNRRWRQTARFIGFSVRDQKLIPTQGLMVHRWLNRQNSSRAR